MKYPYTCTRGTITYVTSDGYECGRERFSLHRHDRGRFVRAVCEMEEEGLLRDASWSLDENWRPVDGHVRVALGGNVTGSTSYAFNGSSVTCHALTDTHGQVSLVKQSATAYEFLGLHSLICDGLLTAARGRDDINRERGINSITCSYSLHGEEGLLAFPIDIGVTYLGEERLTVAAGEFDAHKFHVRWRPEWTPAAIWVWGEDYIFLKSMWEVSGLTCELTSLEVVPPIT